MGQLLSRVEIVLKYGLGPINCDIITLWYTPAPAIGQVRETNPRGTRARVCVLCVLWVWEQGDRRSALRNIRIKVTHTVGKVTSSDSVALGSWSPSRLRFPSSYYDDSNFPLSTMRRENVRISKEAGNVGLQKQSEKPQTVSSTRGGIETQLSTGLVLFYSFFVSRVVCGKLKQTKMLPTHLGHPFGVSINCGCRKQLLAVMNIYKRYLSVWEWDFCLDLNTSPRTSPRSAEHPWWAYCEFFWKEPFSGAVARRNVELELWQW